MNRTGLVVGLAITAITAIACESKTAPVAVLLEGQGAVERQHGPSWAAAPNGQPFVVGDSARTGPSAWARLRLRGGSGVVRLGADTLIRFAKGGARLESGEAEAEIGAVAIETEAGPAQIEVGGKLRAAAGPKGVRYDVMVGRAVITREDGPVTLGGGEGLVVAVGGAIVERITPEPAPKPDQPPVPPPAVDEPPPVATVAVSVTGRGVTARTGKDPWRPVPAGAANLTPGATIKVPRGATLALARGDDRATFTGPAELDVGAPDGPIAASHSGAARVVARTGELAVAVPGGIVVTRAGDAGVDVTRGTARVRVERGEATLDGTRTDAVAQAGETGVITKDGDATVRDPVPTSVDVGVPAGETAIVHDPGRRVAVRIAFGDACGSADATLELADLHGTWRDPRRIGGGAGAAFFAPAGMTRYRVRCSDGRVARQGGIAVSGDTGAAQIVKTPPQDRLDLDGHKYTVLYQNRLPGLSVRWPGAPAGATVLHVAGAAAERTFDGSGTIDLLSGALPEGSYTIWMTSGDRSSTRTRLRIAFDNAAPAAQITSPPPGAVWGDSVAVAGSTLDGWTVAVDGVPVAKDGAGRFKADVATGGKSAFAIRIAHPQHGVHYYIRRRK